ncbi:hypothetical protein BKA69DRAFT_224946 [Paraphysoderma sedebokerense]|nr:hypothetical protein BKA69DRAFT_224946 [Paraphysoderma sedebokerense]
MAASIKYLVTSQTPLQGFISQHFDRFMQSSLTGNIPKAWKEINFYFNELVTNVERISEAFERSMIVMMRGEQPPTADLQLAGLLPGRRFALQNVASRRCLEPRTGAAAVPDGTPVQFGQACEAEHAKFEFTETGAIRHVKSGKCIHPVGGRTDRNTALHFWTGCDQDYLPFRYSSSRNLVHVKSGNCLIPVGTTPPGVGRQVRLFDFCAVNAITNFNLVYDP